MQYSGICTYWHYLRRGSPSGQIATWVTLIIIVIFLFVAVTVNVGRLAYRKTMTANAADGAAMKLASYIGSYANMLSQKYVRGRSVYCQRNYQNIYIGLSILIIYFAWSFGAFSNMLASKLGTALLITSFTAMGYNTYQQVAVVPGEIEQALQRQFAKLSFEGNLTEQAIYYALTNVVDDPNQTLDIHDYDEDMDTTDLIPQFAYWYMDRVRTLVDQNAASPEVRQAIADFLPLMEAFATQANEFRTAFTEDATRPLIVEPCDCPDDEPECDCAEEELTVLQYAEIDGEFTLLLRDLDDLGYTFTFWKRDADSIDNSDELDDLSSDLYSFYDTVYNGEIGVVNREFDEIVSTRRVWIPLLYSEELPEEGEAATWYNIWAGHIEDIESWQAELTELVYPPIYQLEPLPELDEDSIERLKNAINNPATPEVDSLEEFKQLLITFNAEILAFEQAAQEQPPAVEREAYYSWHDSLGWHHTHVEVSAFNMPTIRVRRQSKWYGYKICILVAPPTDTIWVEVDRYDQSSELSFLSRERPFWRSRYVRERTVRDAPDETRNIDPADALQALPYGMHSFSRVRWYCDLLPEVVEVR